MKKNLSSLKRAHDIKKVVDEHYEAHRQDRNYRKVWLNHVLPLFGVSYGVCLEAISTDTDMLPQLMKERIAVERRKLHEEALRRRKRKG
ncbi:MAG: hypothetical protein K2J51_04640 [Alistipes sp.]|nr:hypothetical protein [Alistipes sp.]MDE6778740.1 hypothetical protein [Alistipes sp.]